MKLIRELSLQWKITLLVGVIIVMCTSLFTIATINSADRIYGTALAATIESGWNIYSSVETIEPIYSEMINIPSSAVGMASATKTTFSRWSYKIFVIVTVLGMTGVYFAIGKALKPVKKLSSDISEIDEKNLAKRIDKSDSTDEIGNLINGFNRMLLRLEEAFKRQNRFTASAAHELKTPLATIKAGIQVLNMDDEPSINEYKENIRITEVSVDRLINVVDDLLLLASDGEPNMEDHEEIFIETMFEAILDEVAPLYISKDIKCNIKCDHLKIMGNHTLLYRAFSNLIENAHKYNVDNGEILVSAKEHSNKIEIIVEDTGIGIPKEQIETIFEPFYRVEQSRSRKIAGSGLGLSIVKTIVESYDGTIKAKSELGNGTQFIVTFHKSK